MVKAEKSQKLKMYSEQDGYILGLVMVFFIVFTIIGLAFTKMGSHERIQSQNYYNKVKAFYQAEAGIHKGLWLVNHISSAAAAAFSDSTVSVVYDSVNLIMTATGSAGNAQKIIQVTLESSGGGGGSSVNESLRPMGSGAYSNNYTSGCSSHWQCVDEVTTDEDATFLWGNGGWKTDTFATEDPSTGSGTIDSVVVYMRVRTNFNGVNTRTVIYTYNSRYYGSIINMNGVNNYTDFTTTHTTNPATSNPWTWSEIDAMQVGVRIKGWGRCTQVWAEVHYSSGGSGGSTLTIKTWEEL